MPSEQSHFLFAVDCLEQAAGSGGTAATGLSARQAAEATAARLAGLDFDALITGTQGPDPFFFYGRLPWARRRDIALAERFADIMHKEDPPRYFDALEAHARGESDDERRRSCLSFVGGLRLHYILDEALHPYVFARQASCSRERMAIVDSEEGMTDRETTGFSGFLDPRSPSDQDYYLSHHRFEARLAMALHAWRRPEPTPEAADTSPPSQARSTGTMRFFPHEVRPRPKPTVKTADSLLSSVPAATGEQLPEGMFAKAWSDMVFVLRLIHDPRGYRARLIDYFGAGDSLMRNLMQPPSLTRSARSFFLNLSGAPWRDHRNPAGPLRSESVPELYETALAEGKKVLEAFKAVLPH
jgi:hypothetical protein